MDRRREEWVETARRHKQEASRTRALPSPPPSVSHMARPATMGVMHGRFPSPGKSDAQDVSVWHRPERASPITTPAERRWQPQTTKSEIRPVVSVDRARNPATHSAVPAHGPQHRDDRQQRAVRGRREGGTTSTSIGGGTPGGEGRVTSTRSRPTAPHPWGRAGGPTLEPCAHDVT